ncbi:MAG: hypothetical protein WD512_01130 [Candidatus Paceibacterota bacterium]
MVVEGGWSYVNRLKNTHAFGKLKYNNFAGKTHSQETKDRISKSHKGKHEGKLNSFYGTCWITNGLENKKIKKESLDNWLELGYNRGRI